MASRQARTGQWRRRQQSGFNEGRPTSQRQSSIREWVSGGRSGRADGGARDGLSGGGPSEAEIRARLDGQPNSRRRATCRSSTIKEAEQLAEQTKKSEEAVKTAMEGWLQHGLGRIDKDKPDGTVRLSFENWNSLKVFTERNLNKVHRIETTRKEYGVDIMTGVETQANWDNVKDDRKFEDLFGMGADKQSAAAHNRHWKESKTQYGGAAMTAIGRVSGFVDGRGTDSLGRWAWMYFRSGDTKARIITAYRPKEPSKVRRRGIDLEKGGTVWEQQWRYFKGQGYDDKNPLLHYDRDLSALLKDWRRAGDEIILCIDANAPLHKGKFLRKLTSPGIDLIELFQRHHERQSPPSHRDGSIPISGIFVTPGIDITNVFVSGHNSLTQGDHRLWLVDIDMRSLLGCYTPTPKRTAGRLLKCKNEKLRDKYVSMLENFCKRHKMKQKLRAIEDRTTKLEKGSHNGDSWEAIDDDFNKWDEEHVRLQRAAENKLSKAKSDRIEYSPESNAWIRRMQVLRWIESWRKKGSKKSRTNKRRPTAAKGNPANLKRACRNNNLPPPDRMTDDELARELTICKKKLCELQIISPNMRRKHLERRLKHHLQHDNKDKVHAIAKILAAEKAKRIWKNPRRVFKKRPSAPPSTVETKDEEGNTIVYSDKTGVERAVGTHLIERFGTGRRKCPFEEDGLKGDFGFKASTTAMLEVLDGSYEPPEDADESAVEYLKEAQLIWEEHQTQIDVTFSNEEYTSWWRTGPENTASSKCGIHFGHYKAQASSKLLTSLQVRKLNLVYRRGVPLRRWLHGLTLLLAKKAGGSTLDKLRAICLFEADCNWSWKVIFAKKMMENARDHDLLPPELFARSGTSATEGCIARIIWCDINMTLNRSFSVQNCDLGQCYDAINHVAASVALQSFGVPMKAADVMHTVLQEMKFWLRSAFGDSDAPFSGSDLDPTMGEGQGSGGAPPTWTSISTLMIRLLKKHGFHTPLKGSWSDVTLHILAILFVDDIDMLLAALSTQNNNEFIEMIQRAINEWGKIVMTTGGYLKQVKCQVALAVIEFVNGQPKVKQKSALNGVEFTIPTKDGDSVPIKVLGPNDAVEALGITTDLVNSGEHHLKEVEKKMVEWISKLKSSRILSRADVWLSFFNQLKPKLLYSIECMSAPPAVVDSTMHKLFYKSLSHMGVNKHIRREARCLPSAWGGLGFFVVNIENLGARCLLLQNHWATSSVDGTALQTGYETFRVDTGLGGNILTRNYDELEHLAKHSWWKMTWQLCHLYCVSIKFPSTFEPPAPRENDSSLMDVFVSQGIWNQSKLAVLNRVRRHKKVFYRSDVIACDGRTVRPDMLTNHSGSSTWVFAREQPTNKDFDLWRTALASISSPNFTLQTAAGRLLRVPANHCGWYIDASGSTIVRQSPDGPCETFQPTGGRPTRQRLYRQDESPSASTDVSDLQLATISSVDNDTTQIRLHSRCLQPQPRQDQSDETLLDVLRELPNPGLWDNAECDGDGWWIGESLNNGDLVVVSDGSYKSEKAIDVCSCAFRLLCKRRKLKFQCTWAERIPEAGIYRGEILGALGYLIVLRVVTSREYFSVQPSTVAKGIADNTGVIKRARNPNAPLKMNPRPTFFD